MKEFKSNISNVEVAFISLRKSKKKLYLKISLFKTTAENWPCSLWSKKKLSFMYTKLTELNLTTLIILGHEENLYLGGFMCSLSSSALVFCKVLLAFLHECYSSFLRYKGNSVLLQCSCTISLITLDLI